MRLSMQEKETIIIFNEKDENATVYTCNDKLKTKLKRFEKKYKNCIKGDDTDEKCSVRYIVPKNWIDITPPKMSAASK